MPITATTPAIGEPDCHLIKAASRPLFDAAISVCSPDERSNIRDPSSTAPDVACAHPGYGCSVRVGRLGLAWELLAWFECIIQCLKGQVS
jgi:hypothetical protein